jgi:CheY-like chemotaxis protein
MARILVVDDSEDVRLALATLLEDAGYEVLEAEDGSEVMALALSGQPDLVLLDIAMPRMDGFETLRCLKADARTNEIPVIMVTAKGRPEDLSLAQTLGARDYINKPWADGEVEMRANWALTARAPRH